uniref:DM2 domain-containing protein n=1 Tax=viral metagenome TaxID=1070528 RepID=A0A6C0KGB2_9ZZZZ
MPRKEKKTATATATATETKTKTKAKAEPKIVAPAPEPVVEKNVEAPVVTKEVPEISLNGEFTSLLTQFSTMRVQMTQLAARVRTLQKRCDRELRTAAKASKKKKIKSGNRAPSGFVKPTQISGELATFLGKPKGTEMARTEVTREINQYIREHKLQDPSNGRRILPDPKLRKLLRLPKEDELTYFNLQRYMSPHFAKAGVPLTF